MRDGYAAAVLVLALFSSAALAQEDKVYPALSTEQLERTLKGANIDFKKLADKTPDSFFYDYKSKTFNVRLYYFGGRQLMLDTLFAAMSLEKVNQWNLGAKFSRAGLGQDDKGGSFTVIESYLNLKGGVTESAVKEFLHAFVEEMDQFQKFVAASELKTEIVEEKHAYKEVPADVLEKILEELKIKYAKVPLAAGGSTYQYESMETKIVLTNWGKDMMLEAKFKKIPLEKVNQYNLDRKFIRTVSYSNKKGEYTNLEANLGFTGGVTQSILRNFIAVFAEDVREFGVFVKKNAE